MAGLLVASAVGLSLTEGARAQSGVRTGPAARIGPDKPATASKRAQPRPTGTSYGATTMFGSVSLVLSRDGRMVRRATVIEVAPCSDGTSSPTAQVFDALVLTADRRFQGTYDSGPQASPLLAGITVQITASLSGQRNKLGTKVIGVARFTAVTAAVGGTTITCDTGPIRFVAED